MHLGKHEDKTGHGHAAGIYRCQLLSEILGVYLSARWQSGLGAPVLSTPCDFQPADKSFEEIGHFEGGSKFVSCAVTLDGKVVLVPCNYPHVVVFNLADKSFEELGHFEGEYFVHAL